MTLPTDGTSPTPPAPNAREKLDRLQRELTSLKGRINRSTTLTVVVVAAGLILLGGYLIYGYVEIAAATQPNAVVDAATGLVDESLPEARKALRQEITKSAPAWAAGLSKEARDQMPALRKKLEQLTVDGLDSGLREADLLTEKEIKEFFA